jgi:hypothetical protein
MVTARRYFFQQYPLPNSLYNCKLTAKGLAEVPKEIKKDLLEATAELDQKGCFAILENLYLTHKEVASILRRLAENYQFEELENIIGR